MFADDIAMTVGSEEDSDKRYRSSDSKKGNKKGEKTWRLQRVHSHLVWHPSIPPGTCLETDELRVGWMGRLNGAKETEQAAVIANYERK